MNFARWAVLLSVRRCFFVSMTASFTLVICCVLGAPARSADQSDLAQLVVYVETPPNTVEEFSLDVAQMTLIGGADTIVLEPLAKELRSLDLAHMPVRLVEQYITPGEYGLVHITFDRVTGFVGKAPVRPTPPAHGIDISLNLQARAGLTQLVVLRWTPQPIQPEEKELRPALSVIKPDSPPLGSLIFVSNEESNNISVIDRLSFRVVDVIRVGEQPRGLAWSPLRQQLYVASAASAELSVVDGLSRQVVRTTPLGFGDEPSRVMLSPDESTVYVLNTGSNILSVVDAGSLQELSRLSIGDRPRSMTLDQVTGYVYVANELSNNVLAYDPVTRSVVGSFSPAASTAELAFSSLDKKLFVAGAGQRTLTVYDLRTGTSDVVMTLCSPAVGLAFSPQLNRLFASLATCAEIAVLMPEMDVEVASIGLTSGPGLVALTPDSRQLLVTLPSAGQLAVYNSNSLKLSGLVNVGRKPYMAVAPQ